VTVTRPAAGGGGNEVGAATGRGGHEVGAATRSGGHKAGAASWSVPHKGAAATWSQLLGRSAFLMAVLVSGCERPDGESEAPAVSVRDSAGVTIVEHSRLARSDSTGWWIDEEASVQIGLEEGPAELLFGRVAGFNRMRDGRFAVGDAMGPWVRIYDPDGTLSETIGGPGEGPGEFINFSALHSYAGDSLLVVDYEGGRWTVLDPEGGFVRSWRPTVRGWTREFSTPMLFGFFADGTALLGESEGYEHTTIATVLGGQELRLEEGRIRLFRADAEGEISAEFGSKVMSRGLASV
jgi:hypothetical protein